MTTTGPPTVYPTLPKEEWTITVCFGRKPRAVKSVTREPSVLICDMVNEWFSATCPARGGSRGTQAAYLPRIGRNRDTESTAPTRSSGYIRTG
jgi:hypothetical protein